MKKGMAALLCACCVAMVLVISGCGSTSSQPVALDYSNIDTQLGKTVEFKGTVDNITMYTSTSSHQDLYDAVSGGKVYLDGDSSKPVSITWADGKVNSYPSANNNPSKKVYREGETIKVTGTIVKSKDYGTLGWFIKISNVESA